MKCPKCKLESPDGAERCDCGYDFASGTMRDSYLTESKPRMRYKIILSLDDENTLIIQRILIALLGFVIYVGLHFAGIMFQGMVQVILDPYRAAMVGIAPYGIPNLLVETVGLFITGRICVKLQPDANKPFLTGLIYNPAIPMFVLVTTSNFIEIPLFTLLIPFIAFGLGCASKIKKMKPAAMTIGIMACIFLGCALTIYNIIPPGTEQRTYYRKRDYGPDYPGPGEFYLHSLIRVGNTRCYAWTGSFRVDEHSTPPWEAFSIGIYYETQGIKVVGEGESREVIPTVGATDYFRRWIPKEKVPMELWDKPVEDLVSYNRIRRKVTFDLGFTNYTYQLPKTLK